MSKGQSKEQIGEYTFREANLYVTRHYKRTYGMFRDIFEAIFGKGDNPTELGSTDGGGHLAVDSGEVIDDPFPEGLGVVRLEDENDA